jgi:hypothetical protein
LAWLLVLLAVRVLVAGKAQEDLLQGCLADRVVLNVQAVLGPLHLAEDAAPVLRLRHRVRDLAVVSGRAEAPSQGSIPVFEG